MASPVPDSPRVRFGPFELDPSARRLLKSGIPLKLQPQPFHVLLLLTSCPGKVVSREEIRRHLWDDSTFVDFEHGINFSINQIRAALCDNAEKPRYIETLPRVGYRFIGTLELLDAISTKRPALTHISTLEAVPPMAQIPTSIDANTRWWSHFGPYARSAALGLVALAVAFGALFYKQNPTKLTTEDTVILTDFNNRTGEGIFDETLKQALAIQLGQSPFLNIFSEDDVQETLRYMGRSPNEHVTTLIAREICERRGIKAMVTGSISSMGRNYEVALEARNCLTGEPLAQQLVEVQGKEEVLRGLEKTASNLRAQLGESIGSIQTSDAPLEQVTTSSLQSLQAYSLAQQELARGADDWDAIPFLKRAIELDPNFAMAYATLGDIYSEGPTANDDLATDNLTRAFELRDHVSGREKFYVTSSYHESVTRELSKAVEIYELWKRTYPRDVRPYRGLAGLFIATGQYEKAADNAREALRLRPDQILSYERLAAAFVYLNRWNEAKAICSQALARKLDGPRTHWRLYTIAFIENDQAGMQQELAWAENRGEPTRIPFYQGLVAAYLGKLKQSSQFIHQTMEIRRADHDEEGAALALVQLALMNAEFGFRQRAREQAASTRGRLSGYKDLNALAFAIAGDAYRAEVPLKELEKRFPQDTRLNSVRAPIIRAAIEMNQGKPSRAIDLLRSAIPYELGADNAGWGLLPIYLRGQAYLQTGAGSESAAEFQKIVDHRGIDPLSPLHALARLGRARAYAMQGNSTKAQIAYQDFLTLWKDADSDIPILKQAQAENARLQSSSR